MNVTDLVDMTGAVVEAIGWQTELQGRATRQLLNQIVPSAHYHETTTNLTHAVLDAVDTTTSAVISSATEAASAAALCGNFYIWKTGDGL